MIPLKFIDGGGCSASAVVQSLASVFCNGALKPSDWHGAASTAAAAAALSAGALAHRGWARVDALPSQDFEHLAIVLRKRRNGVLRGQLHTR